MANKVSLLSFTFFFFLALCFTFKSMIHFELIFVQGMSFKARFVSSLFFFLPPPHFLPGTSSCLTLFVEKTVLSSLSLLSSSLKWKGWINIRWNLSSLPASWIFSTHFSWHAHMKISYTCKEGHLVEIQNSSIGYCSVDRGFFCKNYGLGS